MAYSWKNDSWTLKLTQLSWSYCENWHNSVCYCAFEKAFWCYYCPFWQSSHCSYLMKFCSNHSRFYRVSIVLMHLAHSIANLFDNWLQIPFGRKILRLFQNNREKPLYICWFVRCRLSRKVQDSYCSVQNIQDKRAFVQGRANVLNRPGVYKAFSAFKFFLPFRWN